MIIHDSSIKSNRIIEIPAGNGRKDCTFLKPIGGIIENGELSVIVLFAVIPWCSAQRIKIYMLAGGKHTDTKAARNPQP
jgi:hypothetical protein